MERILFKEEQRFDQLLIKVPLYVLATGNVLLFLYAFYHQLLAGRPWGDNPMSDTGLIIVTCFTVAIWTVIILLFEKSKLITRIDEREIRLRFPPLIRKEKIFPVESIKKMEIRTYNPIWEFGGWGIRHGFKGKAYNVRGNIGLQLYFANGKRLLIGTQKPEQMKWAVSKILSTDRDNM
jgi:hypothetical protein